ncbi:hypothetical protein D049_3299A, partial [Vibrio parahaemolyticus VPTS-2010]|jgi:hypothetical protein
MTYK